MYGTTLVGSTVRHSPSWTRILNEWRDLQNRYVALSRGDVAYWYNKNTNAGVFTGAIWHAYRDAFCLPAPVFAQGSVCEIQEKPDLWFRVPQFTCEAAFDMVWPEHQEGLIQQIQQRVEATLHRIQRHPSALPAELMFAGCFVVPYLRFSEEDTLEDSHYFGFSMLEDIPSVLSARTWVSAFWMPAQSMDTAAGGPRRMPGVALVGQVVAR